MTQPGLRFDRTCPTLRIPMQEDPNKNMAKDNRVAFECPHLEARIRQELISRFGPELKERPIADGDLDRLNEALQADDGNLALNGYGISDLSPLAGLTNLRSLYVNSSRIRDFSPLRELPGFVELALGPSLLSPSEKENLNKYEEPARYVLFRPPERMEGSEMEIEDLTPLAGLRNLKALDMASLHKVADLSPLSALENLRSLRLSGYGLSDYSPLFGLGNLEALFLPHCRLTDPAPLAKLRNLKSLVLLRSAFTDRQIKALAESLPGCSVTSCVKEFMRNQ